MMLMMIISHCTFAVESQQRLSDCVKILLFVYKDVVIKFFGLMKY